VAGFDNDVVYGTNIDLSGAGGGRGGNATILTNGQLLIGTTALNAGGTHVTVGVLTSPGGTLNIGYSSPNITLDIAGGGQALETLSSDIGTLITPSPTHNIQLVGHVNEQGATKFSTVVAGTNIANINPMSSSRWIVDPLGFNGTSTSIAAAITSATSGDTIFIMPGTYTENLTLKAGVNLTAYGSDSSLNGTGHVIINGICTMTTAGTVTISGIQLQTNSAALLAVTGSAASVVNIQNCFLNCLNNTGISFTVANASAAINISDSMGDIGTTGITLYVSTSTGSIFTTNLLMLNSGGATTASSNSAGIVNLTYSQFNNAFSSSSTGGMGITNTFITCGAINTTCLTLNGTGQTVVQSSAVASGTASAISIGTGVTADVYSNRIASSNTNAITGAGTINYGLLIFSGTSQTINTTTQVGGTIKGGVAQAPSAGYLGEQIRANATGVVLVSTTAKTITSINLTPGIWDLSAVGEVVFTGGGTTFTINISTTNNTITGTQGDAYTNTIIAGMGEMAGSIPSYRVTVTATTTYYLVMTATFVTTGTAYGRISATRVG